VQRVQRAEGHRVRGDEDGVDVRAPRKQLGHRAIPGVLGVVALLDQGLVERVPDDLAVPLKPSPPAGGVKRARDGGDPAPAGRPQVLDHGASTAALVGRHVGDFRLEPERRAAGDVGDARRAEQVEQRVAGMHRHQQGPVHVARPEEAGDPRPVGR